MQNGGSPALVDAETALPRNADGVPVLNLKQITKVGIADLTAVAEHHIESHFGSISHHVRLHNGGVINFAYSENGSLLELGGEQVIVAYSGGGIVIFDMLRADAVE